MKSTASFYALFVSENKKSDQQINQIPDMNSSENSIELPSSEADLQQLPIWKKLQADTPALWQCLIQLYFKHLEQKSPTAFQNTPKQLFTNYFMENYEHACKLYDITPAQWLNLRAGNLKFIATECKSLQWCYKLCDAAVLLQHHHAIPMLYNLLQQFTSSRSDYDSIGYKLFLLSAKYGFTQIVVSLLKNPILRSGTCFGDGTTHEAFTEAASAGHFKIVELLLKQNVNYINDEIDLAEALEDAIAGGHLNTVIAILKYRPIENHFIYKAYVESYKKNNRSEIFYLLAEVLFTRCKSDYYLKEIKKFSEKNKYFPPDEIYSRMDKYQVPLNPINCRESSPLPSLSISTSTVDTNLCPAPSKKPKYF